MTANDATRARFAAAGIRKLSEVAAKAALKGHYLTAAYYLQAAANVCLAQAAYQYERDRRGGGE